MGLFTQGIGLRPQPWAKVSRPVGPVCGGIKLCESDDEQGARVLTGYYKHQALFCPT
jgi:hypothetical protein